MEIRESLSGGERAKSVETSSHRCNNRGMVSPVYIRRDISSRPVERLAWKEGKKEYERERDRVGDYQQ